MTKIKIKRKQYVLLGMITILAILSIPISTKAAVKNQNIDKVSLAKMKVLQNDATVDVKHNTKEGKSQIHITTGQSSLGYNTPIFYWNQQIKASDDGEFDFYIENPNESVMEINLNVTSKAYGSLGLYPGSYVVGVEKDKEETVFLPVDKYGFQIPSEFVGIIKIPFYLLKGEDLGLMLQQNLGVLSYIGITVVCKQNSDLTFSIADTGLIRNSDVIPYTTIAERKIIGDDTISKPSYGKIFTNYQVYSYDMLGNYKSVAADFSLKYEREGIETNKDGKVIVSSESMGNKFILLAKIAGEADLQKQVTLQNSWTVSTRTQNGYDASVPRTQEVKQISSNQGFFYSDDWIDAFWGLCIAIFIGFSIFYIWHRHSDIFSKRNV